MTARATGRYHELVCRAKRAILAEALARAGGNITHAAAALELERTHLHALLRKFGVPRMRRRR